MDTYVSNENTLKYENIYGNKTLTLGIVANFLGDKFGWSSFRNMCNFLF